MLTMSPEALDYISMKNKPIFLDFSPQSDCWIHLIESPTVRFGEPRSMKEFCKLFREQQYIYPMTCPIFR